MAIVEEEVMPLDEVAQPAQQSEEAPPSPPKLERQKAVDWKEKVACEGCGRVLSRHTLEFTHKCKGPKPAKAPRARLEPQVSPEEPPPREEPQREPPPTRDQLIRAMLREEKQKREAVQCGPMRRFYGLA